MRKFLVIALALVIAGFSMNAMAYEGDFEMSGHINTGFGYQYNSSKVASVAGGIFTEEGMAPIRLGNFGPAGTKNTANNLWLFYVGDVELDITKTFGENIRLRADLDLLRLNSYSYHNQPLGNGWSDMIEQAYITINIPIGMGVEFLVGRFNAPMGFEAVDNNDNDLPFHTAIFNFLRPQNLTGLKFYYAFSDLVDLHIWLANNLRDVAYTQGTAALAGYRYSFIPAAGFRLGFTWGMEGQESVFGLSGAFSPEAQVDNDKWGTWSWIGDIDFNIWVNDVFAIGGEGIFRMDDSQRATVGKKNNKYYGGLLNLHYVFSDVWDGTLRYAYAHDVNGATSGTATLITTLQGAANQYMRYAGLSALGADVQLHQIDLGVNYHITDGAKLMAMYRFEMIMPDKLGGGFAPLTDKAYTHSIAANFAYEF